MSRLTMATIKATDVQCAPTVNISSRDDFLKAEAINAEHFQNLPQMQNTSKISLFVQHLTSAFTNFYYNPLALSL